MNEKLNHKQIKNENTVGRKKRKQKVRRNCLKKKAKQWIKKAKTIIANVVVTYEGVKFSGIIIKKVNIYNEESYLVIAMKLSCALHNSILFNNFDIKSSSSSRSGSILLSQVHQGILIIIIKKQTKIFYLFFLYWKKKIVIFKIIFWFGYFSHIV